MKKCYSGPQVVAKLRQADVLIGKGKTVLEVCKEDAVEFNQSLLQPEHFRQDL